MQKLPPNLVTNLEQELRKQKQDVTERYWHMVSLLGTVLNRSNMMEAGNRDDIAFLQRRYIANYRNTTRSMESQRVK